MLDQPLLAALEAAEKYASDPIHQVEAMIRYGADKVTALETAEKRLVKQLAEIRRRLKEARGGMQSV